MQAALHRNVLFEKLHLISQYPPVRENQVFSAIGHIGQIAQLHVSLIRRAVAFSFIAGPAGGDNVHPDIATAARKWHDVIARQLCAVHKRSAISTEEAVTLEQLAVVKRRYLTKTPPRQRPANPLSGVLAACDAPGIMNLLLLATTFALGGGGLLSLLV